MIGRSIMLVALALLLLPSVHAAEPYVAEERGCGAPILGSPYRGALARVGVADCELGHEAALSPSCADGVCAIAMQSAAWATSGHPGEKLLRVTLWMGVGNTAGETATACEARGSGDRLECAGEASLEATVDESGCALVIVSTRYVEERGTGVAGTEARWRLCGTESGTTFTRIA